jgi:hypothetical protein
MKDFNREEYNRICAEFLEWKEDFAHEADKYGYIQTIDGYMTPFINVDIIHSNISEYNRSENVLSIAQLKFDSDWNWIMEVVEKIESLEKIKGDNETTIYRFDICNKIVKIDSCNDETVWTKQKTKKEAVVQAIWEFINCV